MSQPEQQAGSAFLKQARNFLSHDYLPKIERCLTSLSAEDIWWRPNPESNCIGNLLLHLSGNARQWIVSGLGGASDQRERQAEFDAQTGSGKETLLAQLKATVAEVDEVLMKFNSARLLDLYTIQDSNVSALEAIFHVVEHFSMHVGQIIYITKQITAHDLHFYDL